MAIATLIISTLILKATGTTGTAGMIGSICIGSIICIVAAIAGDTSQDLKTGFIVGATPKLQQIGEMVGVIASGSYRRSSLPSERSLVLRFKRTSGSSGYNDENAR